MKKKGNRDLIIFLIMIPLFLWGAFYISSISEGRLPPYTVDNKAASGCSVFFHTLKELGYNVEKTLKPIEDSNMDDFMVIAQTSAFNVNDEDIKRWVKQGGKLVFLNHQNLYTVADSDSVNVLDNMRVYKLDKGVIIACDSEQITNKTLAKKTDTAYELLKAMDQYEYKSIIFNESYIYASAQNTLWNFIPIEVKFLIYQFLIVLTAFFYWKGKRFGKPLPLYDEVERTENEYLHSAASLYRQAGCWDLMADSYYKDFVKSLGTGSEDWLECWNNEGLPHGDIASVVYTFMNNKGAKPKDKEYEKIIVSIDKLKEIVEKRRGSYWKALKRTM